VTELYSEGLVCGDCVPALECNSVACSTGSQPCFLFWGALLFLLPIGLKKKQKTSKVEEFWQETKLLGQHFVCVCVCVFF